MILITDERQDENPDESDTNDSVVMTEAEFEYLSDAAVKDLNPRQEIEYALYRRGFIDWMRERGKHPKKRQGLSESCIENYARRQHQIWRWIWSQIDRFSAKITHDQANLFIRALEVDKILRDDGQKYSSTSKRKFSNVLSKWFEYRHDKHGAETWTPPVEFSDNEPENPADFFTKKERSKIYNAALEYKSPPPYDNVSPEERDRWKAYIAQRLGKPKEAVRPADLEELRSSWKIPSIVGCTLDGALRPIEINRSKMGWLVLQKGTMQIPESLAAKSRENWEVTLRERTVQALRRWKKQRKNKEKYDDSDAIWLNKKGNPYTSKNLNYLLDQLLETAGISEENRKIVWYSFRKSTATYVQSESDDITTADVLRSTPQNVKNYADPIPEDKRDILENIDG
jgi:site-specific recombinase XerD